MSGLVIEKVDHTDAAVKGRLLEVLGRRETHALFILGNVVNGFAGQHVYVARRGEAWLGVVGYYEGPKSVCPWGEDPEVVGAMVRHVAETHRVIEYVNSIDYVGRAAQGEMVRLGYEPKGDPRQVFMELEIPADWPRAPHEEWVRGIEERDGVGVARLMRYLHAPGDESPVREEEVARVFRSAVRLVVEVEGEVVSTAATNGLAIEAFQILGVATAAAHRGRGYARAACSALIRRMQGKGAKRCVLFTGLENTSARRCYEGLGFRVSGEYWMAKFGSGEASSSGPLGERKEESKKPKERDD